VIRHLQPRHVQLGHWENLFAPPTTDRSKLRVAPLTDVEEFIRRLEPAMPDGAEWALPTPGACYCYPLASE
jgi:hypothetical protein